MKKIKVSLIKGFRGSVGKKISNCLLVQVWSSLIIFSLSHTLGYLEFSWRTLALDQESKGRTKKENIKQEGATSSNYNRIIVGIHLYV